jgi:hypothetical protein
MLLDMAINQKTNVKPVNDKQDDRNRARAVRAPPSFAFVAVHTEEHVTATQRKESDGESNSQPSHRKT